MEDLRNRNHSSRRPFSILLAFYLFISLHRLLPLFTVRSVLRCIDSFSYIQVSLASPRCSLSSAAQSFFSFFPGNRNDIQNPLTTLLASSAMSILLLPPELLLWIFEIVVDNNGWDDLEVREERNRDLCSFALVHSTWTPLAQSILPRVITVDHAWSLPRPLVKALRCAPFNNCRIDRVSCADVAPLRELPLRWLDVGTLCIAYIPIKPAFDPVPELFPGESLRQICFPEIATDRESGLQHSST